MNARVGGTTGRRTADGRWVARRPLPGPPGTVRFAGLHARAGFPVTLEVPSDPADFERSAGALRGLRRDGHVRLLDVTRLDDAPCLVLEHVEGASLAEILAGQRRVSPLRAYRIGLDVTAALAEAHARDVVHGDVRPDHVVVSVFPSGDERAKLRGHGGVARRIDGFRAPELSVADREPTPTADVWGIGVSLHVAMSGIAPRVAGGPLPGLGELVPVPGTLADLVAWASRVDPGERPDSARELLAALLALDVAELARFDLGPATPRMRSTVPLAPRPPADWTTTVSLLTGTTPSVWVLAGDLPSRAPELAAALEELDGRFDVVPVPETERAAIAERLRGGSEEPPWVVVFDDMAVLLEDPLLGELGRHGETSRLLVSTHANFDLAHHAVNACGLDQHVSLPSETRAIALAVDRLVHRSLGIRRHYDGLRLALRDAHEDLEDLERRAAVAPPLPARFPTR